MATPANYLFDFGRPVAFYPGLVKHLGSVNAVLFFCQIFYWRDRADSEQGVYKTVEDIQAETGLTYREQQTARRQLVERGVLIEDYKRLEHRMYFRIDVEALNALLDPEAYAQSAVREMRNPQQAPAQSAVRDVRVPQVVNKTEITYIDYTEKKDVEPGQAVPDPSPAKPEPAEPEPAKADPVATVFGYWQIAMASPRSLLDDKRRKAIKGALKTGYTVEQLCAAIDGCAGSAWHMGANDRRTKYNGIELILRDAEHIDRFIGLAENPEPARQGDLLGGAPRPMNRQEQLEANNRAVAARLTERMRREQGEFDEVE